MITTTRPTRNRYVQRGACLSLVLLAGAAHVADAGSRHYGDVETSRSGSEKVWTYTPPADDSCASYDFDEFDGVTHTIHRNARSCSIHASAAGTKDYRIKQTCLKSDGTANDTVPETEVAVELSDGAGNGRAIFDFTAHPDTFAITTNMNFTNSPDDSILPECEYRKGPMSGNCIEGASAEVLVTENKNLVLYKGEQENIRKENMRNNNQSKLKYFKDGEAWFDVERLRAAADWLAANKQQQTNVDLPDELTPGAQISTPITGTMTMRQFLRNVANNQVMYGVVRVLVGLGSDANGKPRQCSDDDDTTVCDCATERLDKDDYEKKHGHGTYTPDNVHHAMCHRFEEIEKPDHHYDVQEPLDSDKVCALDVTDKKIKVKGALFFDYVYETKDADGNTVYTPVELDVNNGQDDDLEEISIGLPIWVNWDDGETVSGQAVVDDNSGTLNPDLVSDIKAVSTGDLDKTYIKFDNVPQSAVDDYKFYTNQNIDTDTKFSELADITRYHLLMPSGYAKSWAEAFNVLGVTPTEWENIMKNTGHAALPEFSAPTPSNPGPATLWAADDFRSDEFEDIPAFLYAGGVIKIKTNKVFISGLTYIPQSLTLDVGGDNNNTTTTVYFTGAVMIRDGFLIHARDNGLLLMSSDPNTYSKMAVKGGKNAELSLSASPGVYATTSLPPAGYGGLGAQKQVSPPLWVEIRPQ